MDEQNTEVRGQGSGAGENKTPKTAPKPNIKFVGKPIANHPGKAPIEAEPFKHINNDSAHYVLPNPVVQRAGFFHPHAGEIVRLYPELYKLIVLN